MSMYRTAQAEIKGVVKEEQNNKREGSLKVQGKMLKTCSKCGHMYVGAELCPHCTLLASQKGK